MKPRKLKLGTVEQEAAWCRRAFRGVKVGAWAVHLHHNRVAERLTELPEERIQYILSHKPQEERALRLRLFRPAKNNEAAASAFKAYDEAAASARKAYDEAMASARKAYDDAMASAWKSYDDAIASAWKAYKEAKASAWKAYDEAEASAWKSYDEAMNSATKVVHENFCRVRGCPWDGHTIFPS